MRPTFRIHYEHLSVSGAQPLTADITAPTADAARQALMERSRDRGERVRIHKTKLVRETANV